MRLLAYDYEALIRIAQQAPWREGFAEAKAWAGDVRAKADPRGGFGAREPFVPGEGPRLEERRRFDVARFEATMARLGRTAELLPGDRALRESLGDDPEARLDGWSVYEDLVRLWTALVTPPWPEARLCADAGPGALLGALGRACGHDLRLAATSPLCLDVGKPYPITWQLLPRARIRNVSVDLLDELCSIGSEEVRRAAAITDVSPERIAVDVGLLIRHAELARQLDLVVAVDPDDAAWG